MSKHLLGLILGLFSFSALAYASDPSQFPRGFYVTGQATNSWASSSGLTFNNLEYTGVNVSLNVKNDMGLGGRLGIGYAFNRFLALEGGFSFMPDLTLQAKTTNLSPQITASGKVNMNDVDALLRVTIPIHQFFIYAKGGATYVMLHTNNQVTLNIGNISPGSITVPNDLTSYNTWLPEAVLAAGYAFNRHITADISYGRIFGQAAGDFLYGEKEVPNVDTLAVGLSYYF